MSRHEGRVDHLELLRAAYSQGRSVQRREEQLLFERGVRAELKQPTAWVATHSSYNYTLGALWLYLEHATHRLPTYIEALTDLDIRNVLISDRKEIEAYFIHGNPKTACINQQRRLELSTKSQSRIREQPSSGFEACDAPSKRQKPDPLSGELQVIDFIGKFERPISSKSRSLRCPSKSLDPLLRLLHSGSGEQGRADEKRLRIGQFADGKKLPILIVPESQHPGNVGLANIEKLLTGGEYVSEPPRLPDHQRKCEIAVTMRGRRVGFEVCSNPRLMPPCEWPSVVAVFVQGRKHEFEGWPCADPALIFRQARGFLLRFAGTEESEGLQWNVKQLILDRNVRYRDAAVQREILEDIEAALFQPLDSSSQM